MPVRTEVIDKWVRAYAGPTVVVDSRAAVLFWEERFPVPFYAFRPEDVWTGLLVPAEGGDIAPSFASPRGPVARQFDLLVEGSRTPCAGWVRDDPALAGLIILSWEPGVLRWVEEDEEVAGHPRDPHKRVEAITSSRHVTVAVDGVVLADSHRPVLLFETDLPTRFYLPAEDVDLAKLMPSDNQSLCPYKGIADGYWDLTGHPEHQNVAWSYSAPFPAVAKIAGRISFYNELVDVTVDGTLLARPESPFSAKANRPGGD